MGRSPGRRGLELVADCRWLGDSLPGDAAAGGVVDDRAVAEAVAVAGDGGDEGIVIYKGTREPTFFIRTLDSG
jgi:hypothetical protein